MLRWRGRFSRPKYMVLSICMLLVLLSTSFVTEVLAQSGISYGQTVSGSLNRDTDRWTFSGSAGDVVTIAMNSSDFDTYLYLNGPDGSELARNDDGGPGLNSLINNYTLPSNGTYTIIAGSFGGRGQGDYTLSLSRGSSSGGGSGGSGGSSSSGGGSISYGQSVSGSLNRDQHSWTFSGSAGDVVTIAMNSSDFDTYLYLNGTNGRELTHNDDGGPGLNSLINRYTLPANGTYTIIASSFGGRGQGDYTLSLSRGSSSGGSSGGSGGSSSSGGGSISYGQSVSGSLNRDQHSWTFSGSAGDVVTIAMNSSDFDTYLHLNGPSGEELTRNDDGGPGLNSLIENYTLPANGTYTIIARSFGGSGQGSYSLSLSRGSSSGSSGGNSGGSGGSSSSGGGTISYGQTVNASLSTNFDSWTFSGSAGDVVMIAMNSSDFDTYLYLHAPDFEEIALNDDGGPGYNSLIEDFTLPANGTYTILASSYRNRGRGSYTLSLMLMDRDVTHMEPVLIEMENVYILPIPYDPAQSDRSTLSEFFEHAGTSVLSYPIEAMFGEFLGTFAEHSAGFVFAFITSLPSVGANMDTVTTIIDMNGQPTTELAVNQPFGVICTVMTGDQETEMGPGSLIIQARSGLGGTTIAEYPLLSYDEMLQMATGEVPVYTWIYQMFPRFTVSLSSPGNYRARCGNVGDWLNFRVR